MPILNVFIDDRDMATMERVSAETGRSVDDLAEAAVSEAACQAAAQYQRIDSAREQPLPFGRA